jgi:hypothetical protein
MVHARLKTAALVALAVLAVGGGTASAAEKLYADPLLFLSSRQGNYVGMEVSPAGRKGSPSAAVVGLNTQFLFAPGASIELIMGRQAAAPSVEAASMAKHYAAVLRARSAGPRSWFTWFLKADYKRESIQVASATPSFDYEYGYYTYGSKEKTFHGLAFSSGAAFGYVLQARMNLEFFLAAQYLAWNVEEGDAWGRDALLNLPLAIKYSYMMWSGGHVQVELRAPVSLGRSGDIKVVVPLDAALGCHQVLGDLVLGLGFNFALSRTSDFGREQFGVIATAQYLWY